MDGLIEALTAQQEKRRKAVTTGQLLILAVPITLTLIAQLIALIFGFISNNRRLDDIIKRLERIEAKLEGHESRLTKLEVIRR
jgi:hypothetical protein